jgi:hypothetical protein
VCLLADAEKDFLNKISAMPIRITVIASPIRKCPAGLSYPDNSGGLLVLANRLKTTSAKRR